MTDLRPNLADDEIDLRELFAELWRGKWLILFISCVSLALASLYLNGAVRKHTVSMTPALILWGMFWPGWHCSL